ncbi:MAG: hypothetical protein R2942_00870 [Ignavibacteria bacterium]
MNNSKINSISGDKDNRIYCATFNGLAILENDSITNVKISQITLTDYISRIRKRMTVCLH